MLVKSTRFGDLTVEKKDIITFANGLPGFSDERGFVVLPCQEDSPFAFLQSIRDADLTFLVVDPFAFFSDYEFKLEDELVQELSLSVDNPPQILNIVTTSGNVEKMTANLLAPIIINVQTRQGVQIVLEKNGYSTKHLLFPNGFSKKAEKGGR